MEIFGFPIRPPSGEIDFGMIVEGILAFWTIILLWASWQLSRMIRLLSEQRRELRRWQRLTQLHDKQQRDWN